MIEGINFLLYLLEGFALEFGVVPVNKLCAHTVKEAAGAADENLTSPFLLRMASIVVATVPIMCVYPFLQKYFVKGAMVGAVKG